MKLVLQDFGSQKLKHHYQAKEKSRKTSRQMFQHAAKIVVRVRGVGGGGKDLESSSPKKLWSAKRRQSEISVAAEMVKEDKNQCWERSI